jgi:hypothetical protein
VWRISEPSIGPATAVDHEFELAGITAQDGREFLLMLPAAEPGWSGAAVVQSGKVVGIIIGVDNAGGDDDEPVRTWAVSSREVVRLLHQAAKESP